MTIWCRVEETESKTEDCKCVIEYPQTTIARRKLVDDLATLENKNLADFVFKVENEKFAAHKIILAARSPIFAAMFQHDMQENKTNETEITDVTLSNKILAFERRESFSSFEQKIIPI